MIGRLTSNATCKSCGRPIAWATTENGKKMPVDVEPATTGGNVHVEVSGYGRTPFYRVEVLGDSLLGDARRRQLRAEGEALYLSHFKTCTHASQHRAR
jgi:hypothetical protein